MTLRCWTTLGVLVAGLARAGEPLDDLSTRLSSPPLLRGTFEQEKTVTGFTKPLKSTGDFLLVRGRGLLWNTRKPFVSVLTLTPKGLRSGARPGEEKSLTGAAPKSEEVSGLLLALLSADVATLRTRFRVEAQLLEVHGWRLKLFPLSTGLEKVVHHVQLEGDQFVRRVELQEPRGDVTRLRFAELTQAPSPSDEEEQRLAK